MCSSKLGVQKCECDLGYFGTYCDFKKKELPDLQQYAKNILDEVLRIMDDKYIVQFDVEIIANVARALTNHPDVVDDENFEKVMRILSLISGADVYAHQPYDFNVTTLIMETYTNAQMKIAHSFKLRKAMKDFFLLGKGMNIFYFKNSFTMNNNPIGLVIQNSDADYYMSDSKKTQSLIAGVNTTKTLRSYLSTNESLLYRDWSRWWDKTFDEYCSRVLYKLQPNQPNFTFRGPAFEV